MRAISIALVALLTACSSASADDLHSGETPCDGLRLRPGLLIHHQPFYGCIEKSAELLAADADFLNRVKKEGYDHKLGAQLWVRNGWNHLFRGDLSTAMMRFNQAWLQNPADPDIFHGMAVVLFQRDKNVTGAEVLFERAISNPKVWSGAWSDYARFLLKTGRADDGLKLLKRALTRDPKTPDAYMLLANAEFNLGNTEKACEYARESLRREEQRAARLVTEFCDNN